jgi:catechol 2,3-dioxygenase-like lactoylglutathione lyase family enzyme
MHAGDRSVFYSCSRKGPPRTPTLAVRFTFAFGIARSELAAWESWLAEQGITIKFRETWKYGGEALYFRAPDGHLLEVVTPGVWTIY